MTVPISVIGLMSAAAGCIGGADSVNDELIEFNESQVASATVIGGAIASGCRTAAVSGRQRAVASVVLSHRSSCLCDTLISSR